MRKVLPLLFLLAFVQQVHANIVQGSYRWRNDDGNETTATWKAAQNTPVSNIKPTDVLRLRFDLFNNYSYNGITSTIQLWYNDGTTDKQITSAADGAFTLVSSTNLTNGQATTAQFSGALPFVSGKVVTGSDAENITIPASSRTEYEWVIKPGTGLVIPKTYTFIIKGDNVAAATGPATTLFTSSTLPLKLLSFTAQAASKSVALQWKTAEEDQVSHFEIEKSTDGSRYQVVGNVKAAGSGGKTYLHTDNSNLVANTSYRLKMVDNNGSFTYSPVSHVRMAQSNSSLSVYPNPARDRLHISLTTAAGPVVVSLQDVSGRTIKTFTAQSNGRTLNEVADISSLTPGIYFLSFGKQTVRFVKE
ncbi:MAG: T9SS type A sorting domain-containing protein [Chitinophagaceae bacterium]|nr:MAG: T9SS type A sorting domain-containing protein [Chitinophagaceae bacterium]